MKTIFKKPVDFERKWYIIDAEGKTLGKLAARVAYILRGKNKAWYTPHQECGDFVVIINAEKIVVTGAKLEKKIYYRHSGYIGSLKERTLAELLAKNRWRRWKRLFRECFPKIVLEESFSRM